VFYFGPGQGGDAQANVARWASMFTTPDGRRVEANVTETQGERPITRIEASGTYHPTSMGFGGDPPAPRPGYMLLGAIVPGADANWFFRCTGPLRTVASRRPEFDRMLASIR